MASPTPVPALTKLSPQEQPEDDIITRIQVHLDQLATQFYASARYLSTHHPLLDFDGTHLDSQTALPIHLVEKQAQTPGAATTPGPASSAPEPAAGPEKKSKKDKKDKKDKDDGEGAEPTTKPPLSPGWTPIDPAAFELDIAELAGDLITKQNQIEALLLELPRDLDSEKAVQEKRIRELVEELGALESSVEEARGQRDLLLGQIEGVIEAVGRRGGR